MKKKLLAAVLAVTMVLTACGGSSSSTASTTAAAAAAEASDDEAAPAEEADAGEAKEYQATEYELMLGTSWDVNSPLCEAAQKYVDDVYEATNGRVKIDFLTNGALGTEREEFMAVAGDELDMTFGGIVVFDMYAPEFGFLCAPYLFNDMQHLQNVLDSHLGDEMKERFLENNLALIGPCLRGVRNLTSDVPINSPDDLVGLKLRMTETACWIDFWGEDGLGATPIPIALGELYNSFQTGVVEASDGPYEQFENNKFYEVQKYLVNTQHVCEFVGLFMSEKKLESLPEDLQEIIVDLADADITVWGGQNCADSAEGYRQKLIDYGMEELNPDIEPFKEKVQPLTEKFFDDTWTVTTYDEIMSYAD